MKDNFTKPELLSPAGNAACALAAFDAGADAVYAGLSKFNARERGDNFTTELLSSTVDYAHKNGKKVYLTLNTLIKECELPELLEMLAQISDIAPDGVLVQDMGTAGRQRILPASGTPWIDPNGYPQLRRNEHGGKTRSCPGGA